MKHLIKFFPILLLAILISCGGVKKDSADSSTSEVKSDDSNLKIDLTKFATQTDLVCGMSLKDGVADTMTFNGKLYGFCSSEDKNSFKASPEKFVK